MRRGAKSFRKLLQIPLKEFGPGLAPGRGWRGWSLRREYLAKEQIH
jgi:hypothetical protein